MCEAGRQTGVNLPRAVVGAEELSHGSAFRVPAFLRGSRSVYGIAYLAS